MKLRPEWEPMAHEPAQPASPTPVFSDPSGRRASLLRRLSWVVCVVFAALLGAVAFTLMTQVPLPGLGGLLPTPPESSSPRVPPSQETDDRPAVDADAEVETLTTAELEARLDDLAEAAVRDRKVQAPGGATGSAPEQPSTPAPSDAAPTPGASSPGSPSENANPQATTKTRNPQAAAKKPSPRVVRSPDEHAATGHGRAADADSGATTAPGRNK